MIGRVYICRDMVSVVLLGRWFAVRFPNHPLLFSERYGGKGLHVSGFRFHTRKFGG